MRPRSSFTLLTILGVGLTGCPDVELFGSQDEAVRTYDFPACITAAGDADRGELADESGSANVRATGEGCARTFTLASTAPRVDNLPSGPRTVTETIDAPSLQTTNVLFDGLLQLAFAEAKENSVDAIRDYAFNDGAPLRCPPGGCFETGRKWNYVWTRDTAYASDLGLGWVDPVRAKNSLAFKLSGRRDDPNAVEIVQDTGTGGSYPVSTDRAIWALGAQTILRHLSGPARTQFRDAALVAAKNTALRDREVVFDARSGLYRGEQSFLDWRAQTYPRWTVPNTVHIAMSKSLSTNLAHLSLLDLVARLSTEVSDQATATTMTAWATDLRHAIRSGFWIPQEGLLSTYRTTELDPSPVRRFDLLGTSLAVLLDATTADEAKSLIASYPTLPKGPPVVFPEEQQTPIYHNRAIWPFVTAYWAKAARRVENDAAFDAAIRSLVRGAALNLSNMENLEAVTGRPLVDDGPWSGPVVNSQRQLWSVAGYIGAIVDGLFGVEAVDTGVKVSPFVTRGLHRAFFSHATSIVLNDLPLRGKHVTVVIHLPRLPQGTEGGFYPIARIRFNGALRADGFVADGELGPRSLFEIDLGPPTSPGARVRAISGTGDYRELYGPRTPTFELAWSRDRPTIKPDFAGEEPSGLTWDVFRDGVRVASGLAGDDRAWMDEPPPRGGSRCYSVEAVYRASGTRSHHAEPRCDWGSNSERVTSRRADDFAAVGGRLVDAYGRRAYEEWGDPEHEITATFFANQDGPHLVQAIYGNGAGGIDTGITCALKHVMVEDVTSGSRAGEGYLVMPQRGSWGSWGDSSFVRVELTAGHVYRVRVGQDARSLNMSAFRHFADYTGGTGGRAGAFFRVNIAEIKLLALGE